MNTRTSFNALFLLSVAFLTAAPATEAVAVHPFDGGQTPVVSVPEGANEAGATIPTVISFSGTSSADRIVSLSSNSPWASIASTVTIPAGQRSASVPVYTPTSVSGYVGPGSEVVAITAICDNETSNGYLTVEY